MMTHKAAGPEVKWYRGLTASTIEPALLLLAHSNIHFSPLCITVSYIHFMREGRSQYLVPLFMVCLPYKLMD